MAASSSYSLLTRPSPSIPQFTSPSSSFTSHQHLKSSPAFSFRLIPINRSRLPTNPKFITLVISGCYDGDCIGGEHTSRVCIHPKYSFLIPHKTKQIFTFTSSTATVAALSEKGKGTDGSIEEDTRGNSSGARTQLDLLDQLTTTTATGEGEGTIREKLIELVGERDDDFSLRLGKKMKVPKLLTVSQKRNIKRQDYLNQVSKRNDTNFFSIVGAFVLLPPLIILGLAIATGYVQLFP